MLCDHPPVHSILTGQVCKKTVGAIDKSSIELYRFGSGHWISFKACRFTQEFDVDASFNHIRQEVVNVVSIHACASSVVHAHNDLRSLKPALDDDLRVLKDRLNLVPSSKRAHVFAVHDVQARLNDLRCEPVIDSCHDCCAEERQTTSYNV